jgi:hypothetical protein
VWVSIPPAIISQAIRSASKNKEIDISWMFKPTLNVVEKKESYSSNDSQWWRQKHDEVVYKKRKLAEQQAAEAAAQHESQHDATAEVMVIPDAALANSADI